MKQHITESDLKQLSPLGDDDPIHAWFGLTYASYLVLPRSVLQSLPTPLQQQLVDALNAITEHLWPASVPPYGTYTVRLRDSHGRFMRDPLRDYERGRRVVTKEDLLTLAGKNGGPA